MVSTLDGSAQDGSGSSRAISGPADQALLGVLRALADVVVVGAGTARAEQYEPVRRRPAFAERRAAAGQAEAPTVAVVTRSGDLDTASALLAPGARTLVVTCAAAPLARLRGVVGVDRVVVAGDDDVDPARAVTALAERGLRRILLEGGPEPARPVRRRGACRRAVPDVVAMARWPARARASRTGRSRGAACGSAHLVECRWRCCSAAGSCADETPV